MRKILLILSIILLTVALAYAVTLTEEATDHVEIDMGVRGQMCLENDCGEVIGGLGNVFSTGSPDEPIDFMMLSFKGNIYRGTTGMTIRDTATQELLGWAGKCSVLDPTAEFGERQIDCRYQIRFSNGEITDILLSFDPFQERERPPRVKTEAEVTAADLEVSPERQQGAVGNFPHETNNYRLVSIEDTISGIVWYPGEESLE